MEHAGQLFDPNLGRREVSKQQIPDGARIVSVLPDTGGNQEFSYLAPASLADEIQCGSIVRMDLRGRRIAGWVIAVDVPQPEGVQLLSIKKVSSLGPPAEIIDLARWASFRWSAKLKTFLRSASPKRFIKSFPSEDTSLPPALAESMGTLYPLVSEALKSRDVITLRTRLDTDYASIVQIAASRGNVLVIVPEIVQAKRLAAALRRRRLSVHLHPDDWAQGMRGGIIIGTCSAVWAPSRTLSSIIVLDEHDDSLHMQSPSWHATDIAIERARRSAIPCLLVSPCGSVRSYVNATATFSVAKKSQQSGWPLVKIVDRKDEEPGRYGLFSPAMVEAFRSADRALAILNRKGRSQMLVCGSCGELVRTEDGTLLMKEVEQQLVASNGETRPILCAICGATNLKRLRLGIKRAAEELSALLGRPVVERSAETEQKITAPIVVGTEASLRSNIKPEVIAFLDFDQEILSHRYRSAERAMSLLTRSAQCLLDEGSISTKDPRLLLIQTRLPDHRVLQAAVQSDPDFFLAEEAKIRQTIGFPPYGALARVTGQGAAEFVRSLALNSEKAEGSLQVMGPRNDAYLLRSSQSEELASLLKETERPTDRVIISVDPQGV